MQENIQRNLKIVKEKEAGATYKELEEKYNISRNTIARIIYRYKTKKLLQK